MLSKDANFVNVNTDNSLIPIKKRYMLHINFNITFSFRLSFATHI